MSYYSIISYGYDLLDVLFFNVKGKNPRTVIQNYIPNEKIRVLDMCCGTFSNGFSVAKKNANNEILGIDISEGMIREAKRKVKKANLNNVEFKQGDAANTELPGESVDYIIIGLMLHECTPELRKGILDEVHRLLKKDGRLIVLEWEKQETFFRKIKFAPMYLLECLYCKWFKSFYTCDKTEFFGKYGFEMLEKHGCNYSNVMIMKKA